MTENPGGVESFLITYYRNIDRSKVQFDFLCNSHDPVAYEEELKALGGKCYHVAPRSKDPVRYYREMQALFKEHASEWNAIWVNVCSLANIDYLIFAKKYGIARRIIHSHNAQNMDSRLRGVLHRLNKQRIASLATDFWACSETAAEWFYNEKLLQKVKIIRNAIDVDKYTYNASAGNKIRTEHGWQNKYVIGNIGRLHFQKNQEFIIDIFQSMQKRDPDSVLVLVGQGEDEKMLREKVHLAGLDEKVYFAGMQSNIPEWLSAMDLFLFPSRFEGLSIAALEAQANGLPMLCSAKVITKEIKITDNLRFISLERSADEWASQIEVSRRKYPRLGSEEIRRVFEERGYDIRTEAEKLEQLLLN